MKKSTLYFLCILLTSSLAAQVTLVPYASSWKYLDNGSDQGTAWRSLSFDDASWKSGSGKFGYGLPDASTVISYGPNASNKYVTTYFRKVVNITNPSAISSFTANIKRDDGVVVYVNGKEVYRNKMPSGTIIYSTVAASGGDAGLEAKAFTISNTAFTSGNNLIAVEIHIEKPTTTTDMAFDLELIGGSTSTTTDVTPPIVQSINRQSPTTEATNATSVTFRTNFSENVSGVDVADFTATTISGTVRGEVRVVAPTGTGGNIYDVIVSSISGTGIMRLDLKSSGTGIQDLAGNTISGGFTNGQTYSFGVEPPPPPPPSTSYGFSSVSRLSVIPLKDATQHKPQAKVWKHAGKWWSALGSTSGFKVYRLDGTTWKDVLTLSSNGGGKADCWVTGDLVHILVFKGASTSSYIASLQYDAAAGTYKQWSQRSSHATLAFPEGCEVATLGLDTRGRMWVAYDGLSSIMVRYSDAPYSNWSAPVTIAPNVKDDDISAIVPIPSLGKVGVFWSDQRSKRFGFRTHTDGNDPLSWTANEVPASQSALNVGYGMADDHMNVTVASNGTLYCAVKTSYNTSGYPLVSLLVRRPAGTWDNLYPVTIGEGTQPIVVLNEVLGKVKVVYGSHTYGADIMYKESPISKISFGAAVKLMDGGGTRFNYATSTHQTYNPDVVIMAMDVTTSPWQTVSVLATDAQTQLQATVDPTSTELTSRLMAYPNPFSGQATVKFTLEQAGEYSISLYDMRGTRLTVLSKGWADAGLVNTVNVDGSILSGGLYFVRLETASGTKTLKMILKK